MKYETVRGSNQHVTRYKVRKQKYNFHYIGYLAAAAVVILAGRQIYLDLPIHKSAQAEGEIVSAYVQPKGESNELRPLTPEEEQDWAAMKRMAHKLAPLYDYPVKIILGQMALESARGTSKYCVERHNCFGIGAYDHDPDQAFYFENKEQAIIEYMRLIKAYYPDAYALRDNPDAMIVAIHQGGYATDPDYVTKVKALKEWSE